jgi:hypothetical protein
MFKTVGTYRIKSVSLMPLDVVAKYSELPIREGLTLKNKADA